MVNKEIIWPQKKSIILAAVILTGIMFYFTWTKINSYIKNYGGIDLRTRVTGTRSLDTEKSPYFYQWKPGDPEYFLSPGNRPSDLANGNVITPASMLVFKKLFSLPYKQIRIIWLILEWIFLILTVILLVFFPPIKKKIFPLLIVTAGIICSDFFVAEMERGQMYLLYTFILSAIFFLFLSKNKFAKTASGFLAGLFLFLRPFAGILLIAFVITGQWNWVKSWVAGFAVGFLLFAAAATGTWKEYFSAMEKYKLVYFDKVNITRVENTFTYPGTIEGMNNLEKAAAFNVYVIHSAGNIFRYVGLRPNIFVLYGIFAVIISVLSFLFYRKQNTTPAQILLFAFGLYILAEIFSPAPRAGYNALEWVLGLSLILFSSDLKLKHLALIVASLVLFHNFPVTYGAYMAWGEFLLLLIIFKLSLQDTDISGFNPFNTSQRLRNKG